MSNTSYAQYIESIEKNFVGASPIAPLSKPANLSNQPRILILSPHPDDECLMAGCALRMQEEWGAVVTVVPYSYGSNPARRLARQQELKDALGVLGFQLLDPRSGGLEKLTEAEFLDAVKKIDPELIISPHARDRHPVHVEAHQLVANAMMNQKKTIWIQTEYWQANEQPNAFVPLRGDLVVKIGEALMKHQGEIQRNPYHLSLPGWYMDQARRAVELIPGFGNALPITAFGQLIEIGFTK